MGKAQLSFLLEYPEALAGAAKAMTEGAEKYGRGNWQKGMPKEEIMDSLLRHLTAYARGESVDPDSSTGALHVDKVVANALMLAELHR